jgi:hypothetical protein
MFFGNMDMEFRYGKRLKLYHVSKKGLGAVVKFLDSLPQLLC